MAELTPTSSSMIALPLLASTTREEASWHGWRPALPLPALSAEAAPEPALPQGDYGDTVSSLLPTLAHVPQAGTAAVELLAPAGGSDAAFAAFHYGADAIYLGLKKFSARAEAENFTLEEVEEVTAYAHSLTPRRRVFVTINTLIREDELAELVEAVAALADIGVDALIIQDLGVYHLVRRHFPSLELHASTQLSAHNGAGARVLGQLGFHRVVLARELTFEEVHDITATAGIETEVFIHGALCYAYSGLCLFSSQTLGRSGNRGKCAYSCRDSYEVQDAPLTLRDGSAVKRDPRHGFPFSMKDLALPDHLPALRAAGVSCFKIEGRKKSPLYVATTTSYYRRLLDDALTEEERPQVEADMQTVFSRPWTHLFVQSHQDKEVADRDTVGHRGALIGHVEAIHGASAQGARLRFRTRRALERHDGLQIDLPSLGKPFGFAVNRLWSVAERQQKRHEVLQAAAGALVEVELPREHPQIPLQAPVYCSSSQTVKQRYRHSRPKPGLFRVRRPITLTLQLSAERLRASAKLDDVEVSQELAGPFASARDTAAMAQTVRAVFDKLGDSPFVLAELCFENPAGCFVPVSRLNPLRRALLDDLSGALERHRQETTNAVLQTVIPPGQRLPTARRSAWKSLRWSIMVDRIGCLDALEDSDLAELDEIVVDITRDHPTLLVERLEYWAGRLGRERVRLALPPLTRRWEEKGLLHKIARLRAAGWQRWQLANVSGWAYLGIQPGATTSLDLSSDWSLYVLNRLAAAALADWGIRRFTLSPEDGLANLQSLLAELAERSVVIVYQDTPQFLAESCAYANLIGGCPGKANCRFESMEMVSSHGERVQALDYHCRTIVLNREPFCLADHLGDLAAAGARCVRADFLYRRYEPAEVRSIWRQLRAGQPVPGGHSANFQRGVL